MSQAQGRALAVEAAPPNAAGKFQGWLTTAHHTGFLLGPSLGGLVIDYVHWRGIFFSLIPIGALGAFLSVVNRKMAREPSVSGTARHRPSMDYPGAVLLLAATLALIAFIDRRVSEILTPGWRVVIVLGFVVFFAGFIVRESAASSPILNLSLFRIRMFAVSMLCLPMVSIVFVISVYLLPFYLQEVLSLSPSFMGLLFMSAPIITMTLSPVGGTLYDRMGPRLPATTGVVLFGAASYVGTILRTDSHWILPTLIIALVGLGSSLFFPSNHAAMIGSVPNEHKGVATGSLYTMFGLGGVFGITLGSFLMTAVFRLHTGLSAAAPTPANPEAFVAAINTTFIVAAGICIVAAVLSLMREKTVKPIL